MEVVDYNGLMVSVGGRHKNMERRRRRGEDETRTTMKREVNRGLLKVVRELRCTRKGGGEELAKEWKRGNRRRRRRRSGRQRDSSGGFKKREKGSQKGGRRSEKRRAVAKRMDRAFPRNRRVTAEAKRRVAGGEDWGGDVRESGLDFEYQSWNRPAG